MCGINGIIYKKNTPNLSEIQRMNLAIKHRGPDDEGIFRFENILLGHRRLSILDLSEKGKQPMSNDGQYWIIYNGEIYNFKELKEQLSQLGHRFYTKTDTEVVLCAFKEWGVESFHKFNGMWSFAILDTKKKKLIISRDRYGVKPCYYYNDSEKLIFSSEIKGIFSSNTEIELDKNKIVLSHKRLEEAFTTIYRNLNIIPPGFYFEIDLHNYEIKRVRWWNGLANFPNISINFKTIQESLKKLLIDAIQTRLVSDVKIATSLSGGIDSSIIFTILNNIDKKEGGNKKIDLNPFIVKYRSNKTFDAAVEISNLFKRKPNIVKYDEESVDNFIDKLSAIEITLPYLSQLEIYKEQNQKGFKVSIDGHGADECLGGYQQDIENYGMYFQNAIVDLYQAITNLGGIEALKDTINRLNLVPNIQGFKIDLKEVFLQKTNINEYVESENLNLIPQCLDDDLKELKNYNFPLQVMYLNTIYGHLPWLLNKWDKASMASSIEIRSPFLDWRFFQYALALPAELKIKGGQNKSILRETFKDMLPSSVIEKKFKQGLPMVQFRSNNKILNLIHEVLTQNDFLKSHIWNSKKIVSDFNDVETRSKKINKIWQIVGTYLMTKGFLQRKEKVIIANQKVNENFNRLN